MTIKAHSESKQKHSPLPWRWGYWVHAEGKIASNGETYYPWYRFEQKGGIDDELVLSSAKYGTELEDQQPDVITSICTGYGGETSIDISDNDAEFIVLACNSHEKLVELVGELYEATLNVLNSHSIRNLEGLLLRAKQTLAEVGGL